MPNDRAGFYETFPTEEFERRFGRVRELLTKNDLDVLLVHGGAGLDQTHIKYLTGYAPMYTTDLLMFRSPAEQPTVFVGISNHPQHAQEASTDLIKDIRLLLPDPPAPIIDRLHEASLDDDRIGLVGTDPRYNATIPHEYHKRLQSALGVDLLDITGDFLELQSVASDLELERVRTAAEITDAGIRVMREQAEPGVTEAKLGAILESTYLEHGGTSTVTFLTAAPMIGAGPGAPLPWKTPSSRTLQSGDVITTELGAASHGYSSQVHRPYTVDADPTNIYRDLFEVALEAYENAFDALRPGATTAELHDALAPIEESPFKLYDVGVHGYGIGYRPPFIGTNPSNYWPGGRDPLTERWTFSENEVVAIQPNVATEDERHGLQLGTTVVVRDGRPEDLHNQPVAFERL
jgi:Xaa-Pro aminopeptidase